MVWDCFPSSLLTKVSQQEKEHGYIDDKAAGAIPALTSRDIVPLSFYARRKLFAGIGSALHTLNKQRESIETSQAPQQNLLSRGTRSVDLRS